MLVQQWNGTPHELERLRRAVERNCACAQSAQAPGPLCPAHALLTRQTTLDHLLFVYRTRSRFVACEFQRD
jgi:hypothetical protein